MTETPDRTYAEIAGGSGQALGTPDRVVDADGGTPGEVDSFNGRTGAVVPIQADYDGFFLTQTEGDVRYVRSNQPITPFDAGSVTFIDADGELTEDNANLFYDDTNNRLHVGPRGASPSTAALGLYDGTSTNNVIGVRVTGDTVSRLAVDAAGKLLWGTGAAAADVQVSRTAVGQLDITNAADTNGLLRVRGGIGINSSPATAPRLGMSATGTFVGSGGTVRLAQRVNAVTTDVVTTAQTGDINVVSIEQATVTSTPAGTVIPDLAGIRVKGPVTSGANATATRTQAILVEVGADANRGITVRQNSGTQSAVLMRFEDSAAAQIAAISAGGRFLAPDGVVGSTGLSFVNDGDNGFYRIGTDNFAASVGGGKALDFNTTSIKASKKFYPATDAAAEQTASAIYAGTGVPNNANGADGDYYFRGDGTAAGNTAIYHKEAGAWVGLVTT